jgi:hypothetical protein
MTPVAMFFLVTASICAVFASVPAIVMNYDRIALFYCGDCIPSRSPTRSVFSASLERNQREWTLDENEAKHPTIGTICYRDSPGILKANLTG